MCLHIVQSFFFFFFLHRIVRSNIFVFNFYRDFIKRLLDLDASERPTAAEAMNDPWFAVAHADPVPITAAVGSRLESFVGMGKLKKYALQVIAEHLTEKEIKEVKKMFKELDKSKTGTLTVQELKSALVEFPHIQSQIEELVDGIDLDHNHSVDYNEFLAATLSRNTFIREENIRIAFDHFDEDHTG
jgi:calcium-dependent protein kinase